VRTRHLRLFTSTHSDTTTAKSNVPSLFGPVRAGLTTSQTTSDQQLTELLNCLESVVESLNYKSFTLYDTLNTAMEEVFAAVCDTQIEEVGIK